MATLSQQYKNIKKVYASQRTTVFRAIRRKDQKAVILKTLSKEYPSFSELSSIGFEHDILTRLDVQGVIKTIGLDEIDNKPVVILEDIGAVSLSECWTSDLPLERFFDVVISITKILGEIHHRNIIHKDINPNNIIYRPLTGETQIIDFNSATDLSNEKQDLSSMYQLTGTLSYISPEQTGRMSRDLDYRTDFYSLGVTCFELLTGETPFKADDAMGFIHCHITRPIPDLRQIKPKLPVPVVMIVEKLMSKNAQDRYQSTHGLLKDLEHCREQWRLNQKIEEFELGKHDIQAVFQIPQKLYGRKSETAALLKAFDNITVGGTELLLITGQSGTGKSSLVRQVQQSILDRNGYFLTGKFDQLDKNIPYHAFVQALKDLVKLLLHESDNRLQEWKNRLQSVLGINAGLVVDIVPDFGNLIDQYSPLPKLNPEEARIRLQTVFTDLIGLIAGEQHPLVIFLDDLQWGDTATIDLLIHLVKSKIDHLLFIVSYREDEIEQGHPFHLALMRFEEEKKASGLPTQTISLNSLEKSEIIQMIADIFNDQSGISKSLASHIYNKAKGNPFYTIELLNALNQSGAFEFLTNKGHWKFDLKKIETIAFEQDIIPFLEQQIKKLPKEVQEILKLASCIGYSFNIEILSLISKRSLLELTKLLWRAAKEGILIPYQESSSFWDHQEQSEEITEILMKFRFQHDRIMQIVYNLIDQQEKPKFHLKIARAILSRNDKNYIEASIFDLVNHLSLGRELIDKPEDLKQLVSLYQTAGIKAKHASAYSIASSYFEKALFIVDNQLGSIESKIRFDLTLEHVECIYLSGDFDGALNQFDALHNMAQNKFDQASLFALKARITMQRGKPFESLAILRAGLMLFGVNLPESPEEIDKKIFEYLGKLKHHLTKTSIEDLIDLPEMEDKEKTQVMKLLADVVPSAFQVNPPLYILTDLLMFDFSITHGVTQTSCKSFADCGIFVSSFLGDYQSGYQFASVAFKLIEKHHYATALPGVNFVYANFISHWTKHFKESLEYLDRAIKTSLEMGEALYSMVGNGFKIQLLFYVGEELESCRLEAEKAVTIIEDNKIMKIMKMPHIIDLMIMQLHSTPGIHETTDVDDRLQSLFEILKSIQTPTLLFPFAMGRAFISFLLGNYDDAKFWDEFSDQFSQAATANFVYVDYILIKCLIQTRTWEQISEDQKKEKVEQLDHQLARLKTWSENSPANFKHKYLLAAAEIARIKNEPLEIIIDLYDEALHSIGQGEFVHMKALINELCGEFWSSRKKKRIAKTYILEAWRLYNQWGADKKASLMERQYFDWFTKTGTGDESHLGTSSFSDRFLDISSIAKSTQAISSEIQIEKLQKALLYTMLENAGAERGFLVLKKEQDLQLYIEAAGNADDIQVSQSIPLNEKDQEICVEIVHYVARTQKEVVLNNAEKEGDFKDNSYITNKKVKSVLCLPILYQSELKGVLYLENNLITNTFSPSHLTVLKLISSQAAISLDIAYTYNHLDELVKQRTKELEEAQAELVENAHKVGMSDIATDILHNVGNILNSLKTTGFLIEESVNHSLINDLNKANALLQDKKPDIQNFILNDPNGVKLLEYYLEIGSGLNQENERVLDLVKRIQENIDAISAMISAQQNFLYRSKFPELIDIVDIINNSLAINENELTRNGITVNKFFEAVPKIKGQKLKLLHVIVNILKNAEDAVLRTDNEVKQIDLFVKDNKSHVLVTISDNGSGIEKDHLSRIFSFGYTTKSNGHGIGLHSSANYISEMGGTVWAESDGINRGSSINISFPIVSI